MNKDSMNKDLMNKDLMKLIEDSTYVPEVIVLGIFGSNNKLSEKQIHEEIINPILEELKRMPDKILIPSEGDSSLYIQSWAETMNITCNIFYPDWKKMGKKAQIMRDSRMQHECTHAIVFLSNKTERYAKMAESMTKKHKHVFTSSWQQNQGTSCLEYLELVSLSEQAKASKPVHIADKGIMQKWLKCQMKGVY